MELSKLDHANDGCKQTRFIVVCQSIHKLLELVLTASLIRGSKLGCGVFVRDC